MMTMTSAGAATRALGPKPDPCDEHTRARTGRGRRERGNTFQPGCDACKAVRRWDAASRLIRIDIAPVRAHVEALIAKGMKPAEVANRAGRKPVTVDWILTTDFSDVSYAAAIDILRVPVPATPAECRPTGRQRANTTRIDINLVRKHLQKLARVMPLSEVALLAKQPPRTVNRLARDSNRYKTVHRPIAEAILAVTAPGDATARPSRTVRVPAAATRRRIEGMLADGFTMAMICAALNRTEDRVRAWMSQENVTAPTALLVKELADRWRKRTGPDPDAGRAARAAGMAPRRCWTEDNISRPSYNPLAPDPRPWRVRRRLRSLAVAGHGEIQVAAAIGEEPATVRRWTRNDKADIPVYAFALVDPVFVERAGYLGPDDDTARYARTQGWNSVFDWEVKSIDAEGPGILTMPFRHPDEANVTVMYGASAGAVPAIELTVFERRAVVHYMARLGHTAARIATLLRWSADPGRGTQVIAAFLTRPTSIADEILVAHLERHAANAHLERHKNRHALRRGPRVTDAPVAAAA